MPTVQTVNADGSIILANQVTQTLQASDIQNQINLYQSQMASIQTKLSFYTDLQTQSQQAIAQAVAQAEQAQQTQPDQQVVTP